MTNAPNHLFRTHLIIDHIYFTGSVCLLRRLFLDHAGRAPLHPHALPRRFHRKRSNRDSASAPGTRTLFRIGGWNLRFSSTQAAVKRFQKQQGLAQDGIAGPQTLKKLGITIGTIPAATEENVYLLARIISAEARGEPYTGQVAVGAVVLNRVEHPSFPDTLSGVIYQSGAFTAITDGQFNEPISDSAYSAARDALNGWDPSGGAIYYYNPKKTDNQWIRTRPVIKTIGDHLFCS